MIFLESSRYASLEARKTITRKGRTVSVIPLRRLPETNATYHKVSASDRLDILAHRQFREATQFWRIADANTDLEARQLLVEPGRAIQLPHS